MKLVIIIVLTIFVYIVYSQDGTCDPDDLLACNRHGDCINNQCYCDDEYATEDDDDPCGYKRKEQLVAFLLDFFINGGGQIYLGYLNWGIPRLILNFWPLISFIIILPAVIMAVCHKGVGVVCCGMASGAIEGAVSAEKPAIALCGIPCTLAGCCAFIASIPFWGIIICTFITWLINAFILFVWWLTWIILIGTDNINDANGIAMKPWG